MKNKIFAWLLPALLFFGICQGQNAATKQPILGFRTAKLISVKGLQFKDLNQNGQLDIYEDWRQPLNKRAADLLSKMTLEEKVGFMLISTARLKNDGPSDGQKIKNPIPICALKVM